ncbi:MAG: DMT family transporter [Dehalococcoidia bacterium]|nr:DMT family transporter [Dehalococcoidia bacterium]MDZ4246602.1 DMT family transporter [Dehalococcoidia bacterium]
MLGVILGLGYAAFLGANTVIVRRAVFRVSPNYIATLTIFSGPVFFFLLNLATGELFKLPDFTWKATLFFAISGIVHFALGRTFGYRTVQILGSTRAGVMTGLSAMVSVVLAVTILHETITPLMMLGILFSLAGPTVIALKGEKSPGAAGQKTDTGLKFVDRKTFFRGILFGLCSALLWGTSSIFIKLALANGGSSLPGTFIAYCGASLIISSSLLNKANRKEIFTKNKKSLQIAVLSGMTTNLAQMMRYVALSYTSVIVVSMVSRTLPLWTVALSFIFNRRLESFSRWVLMGNALLIVGTVLVLI